VALCHSGLIPDTTVVIPTYNERENLSPLVRALLDLTPDLEVLVVDDASPDGTGRLAEELAAATGRVRVLHREGKLGLGSAYRDGFRLALNATDAEWICQMDADYSHDPTLLGKMLEILAREECDVVVGSRYVAGGSMRGSPWRRRLLSRGANAYVRLLTGLPIHDATAGFKCFRRSALERIDVARTRADGFAFQVEVSLLAWREGLRIREMPIPFVDRRRGASKMSYRIIWEGLRAVWRIRRAR